jgi:hypothetical protein
MVKAVESRARESHDGKETAFKQVEILKQDHSIEIGDLERQFNDTRATLES